MSQKQKFEELFEEIKAHSEKTKDPDLAAIANKLKTTIAAMDADEEDSGGNNPGYKPKQP